MILRRCKIEDIKQLIQITQTTYREHYQYLWKDKGEGYIQTNYNEKALLNELVDPNLALYFITYNAAIYGFLKLRLQAPMNDNSSKEALEIVRIYLLQKATGKGLGKAVLAGVEKMAAEQNKQVVWLKVMDSSNAVHFYKNCGYVIGDKTVLNINGIYPELQGQWIMKKEIKRLELV